MLLGGCDGRIGMGAAGTGLLGLASELLDEEELEEELGVSGLLSLLGSASCLEGIGSAGGPEGTDVGTGLGSMVVLGQTPVLVVDRHLFANMAARAAPRSPK